MSKILFSVIVPTLNELENIQLLVKTLQAYRGLNQVDFDIIVVDGGSRDGTQVYAKDMADIFIQSDKGRAKQMNAGADCAQGQYLLFIHADTLITSTALDEFIGVIKGDAQWGFFRLCVDGDHWLFKWISRFINWRSSLTSIGTGDQALFISRELWILQQGFCDIEIMEDVELCKRLRRVVPPSIINTEVHTSGRRWQKYGVWKTVFLMWRLRLSYFLGASPKDLKRLYF
jgi:rSAM/selenodomain-associated transferase 2